MLRRHLLGRSWSLAAVLVVLFFLLPVNMMVYSSVSLDMDLINSCSDPARELANAQRAIFSYYSGLAGPESGLSGFILLILAAMLAVSGFSYLHDPRKTDYYHGIPLKRSTHFMLINLSSFLILAVPYLVFSLAAAVIAAAYSGNTGCLSVAFFGFLANMCFFALFYMTVVLAMMLTGNIMTGIFGSVVFFGIGPMCVILAQGFMATFFHTFYAQDQMMERYLQCSSAYLWSMDLKLFDWRLRCTLAALAALVLWFICRKLYQLRRSESAGTAMAFRSTEAPIKILISVPCGLAAGLFFSAMTGASFIWGLFGLVCGTLIAGCVVEIIFRSDFRRLFAGRAALGISLLAALLIFCFFHFDLGGYDRFIPDASKVASAGLHSYAIEQTFQDDDSAYLENDSYLGFETYNLYHQTVTDMRLNDIDTVQELAARCVSDDTLTHMDGSRYADVLLCWHMKNGRDIYRSYLMDFTANRDLIDKIYDSPEYKAAVYKIVNKDPADIASISYENVSGVHPLLSADGADAGLQELFETYRDELMALDSETRRPEYPVAGLMIEGSHFHELMKQIRQKQIEYYGYQLQSYPVYPSFTRTLALLEQYGADITGPIRPELIDSLVITDYRSFDKSGHSDELVLSDPEEIRKILSCCVSTDLSVSNALLPVYNGAGITVYCKPFAEYHFSFRTDSVPASVKTYFNITEQDLTDYPSYGY